MSQKAHRKSFGIRKIRLSNDNLCGKFAEISDD